MRRQARYLASIALAALAATAAVQAAAASPKSGWASRGEWRDADLSRLMKKYNNSAVVTAFVRSALRSAVDGDYSYTNIREYRFVDLAGDGKLELVCTADFGGNYTNNNLMVIAKTAKGYSHNDVETGGFYIDNLDALIVSLRNDGTKQILLTRIILGLTGPMITDVYKFNGAAIYKADAEYPEYYTQVLLPKLKAQISELSQPSKSGMEVYAEEKKNLESEIVYINQMLGL
jgi:hypothetical protein